MEEVTSSNLVVPTKLAWTFVRKFPRLGELCVLRDLQMFYPQSIRVSHDHDYAS